MPSSRPSEGEVVDYIRSTFVNAAGEVAAAPGAGFRWIVYGYQIVAGAAANVKFQSAANDKTALFPLGVNGGIVVNPGEFALFECNDNEALNFVASGAAVAQVQYVRARV